MTRHFPYSHHGRVHCILPKLAAFLAFLHAALSIPETYALL